MSILLKLDDAGPVLLQEEPWLELRQFPTKFEQKLWIGFHRRWLTPAVKPHKQWSALDRMAVVKAIVRVASELVDAGQDGQKEEMVSVLVSSAPVVLVAGIISRHQ